MHTAPEVELVRDAPGASVQERAGDRPVVGLLRVAFDRAAATAGDLGLRAAAEAVR